MPQNMINIDIAKSSFLRKGQHLLGFSGGADSVALFDILCEMGVCFDIAIVHYHTRMEADSEVSYAKSLAKKHQKQCFIAHAPRFSGNFEANARAFRFAFFDDIICEKGYDSLILAHQLNDRLEWLLMQLCKGAGLGNLLGFEEERGYPITRPLESISKDSIYAYCKAKNLRYFEDSSNKDLSYMRNFMRESFSNRLLSAYENGIKKSLAYLRHDYQSLVARLGIKELQQARIYAISKGDNDENLLLLGCDKCAKKLGYVLSQPQRREIIKSDFSCQIHKIIIASNEQYIFIAPKIASQIEHLRVKNPAKQIHNDSQLGGYNDIEAIFTHKVLKKALQNQCARIKIPPKLRANIACVLAFEMKETAKKNENLIDIYHRIECGFWDKMRKFFAF